MKKIKCDSCGHELDLESKLDWAYKYNGLIYCDICSDSLVYDLIECGELDEAGTTTYYEHGSDHVGSSDDISELLENLSDYGLIQEVKEG
jgi:uncharacterized protein YuzB (UPF0349 family)